MPTTKIQFLFCCLALTAAAAEAHHTFLANAETGSPILQVAIPEGTESCASTEVHFLADAGRVERVAVCETRRASEVGARRGQRAHPHDIACTGVEIDDLGFHDRAGRVPPDSIVPVDDDGAGQGPVDPVEGPDGLLWLCREDEEGQQCVCIPWFQD